MVGNSETDSGQDGAIMVPKRAILFKLAAAALLGAPAAAADEAAFRIGMVAEGGSPAIDGLSTITEAYRGALGRPVEVVVARDYATLIEAQAEGRIDYAIYSATAFAAASMSCGCVRAIVAPVGDDGAIGLRSVLLRRQGGDRIMIGAEDSLAGRLAPLALYPQAGEPAFRDRLVEAVTLSEAESAFAAGDAGGLFGWVPTWNSGLAPAAGGTVARLLQAGLSPQDYAIEWQSEPIRFGPHAVRAELDERDVERLVSLLTAGGEPALAALLGHGGGSFARVGNGDYAPMAAILEAARD